MNRLAKRCVLLFLLMMLSVAGRSELKWEKITPYNPWSDRPIGICFGAGKFIAMGGSTLAYSDDSGLTWRQAKGFAPNDPTYHLTLSKVIFAADRFLAISATGAASVSTDCINWQSSETGGGWLLDVAYGNGRFVAAGYQGLVTSTDGNGWEPVASVTNSVGCIAFGNGKFLAPLGYPGSPTKTFLESTDGLNWRTLAIVDPFYTQAGCETNGCKTMNEILGLAAIGGKFAILANTFVPPEGGFNSLLWSDDGIHWTPGDKAAISRTPSGNALHVVNGELEPVSVQYGNGTYVTSASDGVRTGPDLQHLTNVPSFGRVRVDSLAANGNDIFAVGQTEFVASPQSVTMTSRNGGEDFTVQTSKSFTKVRFLNGRFITVGTDGAISAWTSDFEPSPIVLTTSFNLNDVAYGNGHWVVVGEEGIFSSDDGVNFAPRSSATNQHVVPVLFAQGIFVAGGAYNSITISTNGRDWTSVQTELFGNDVSTICYADGRFIAGVNTSFDGRNWSTLLLPRSPAVFFDGLFYSHDYEGQEIFTSADGLSWERSRVDPAGMLRIRRVQVSDGSVWVTGTDSGIWRPLTSVPTLRVARLVADQLRINAELPEPGHYRMYRATVIDGTWQPADAFDFGFHASWSDSSANAATQFYRLKKE